MALSSNITPFDRHNNKRNNPIFQRRYAKIFEIKNGWTVVKLNHITINSFKKEHAMKKILTIMTFCSMGIIFLIGIAKSEPWKFGLIADTQWPSAAGSDSLSGFKNPNSVAVDIINQVNKEFISKGVKIVIAVGDVTDNGSNLALDTRATYVQALYNAGIPFGETMNLQKPPQLNSSAFSPKRKMASTMPPRRTRSSIPIALKPSPREKPGAPLPSGRVSQVPALRYPD